MNINKSEERAGIRKRLLLQIRVLCPTPFGGEDDFKVRFGAQGAQEIEGMPP
jgi:hypothetical protein